MQMALKENHPRHATLPTFSYILTHSLSFLHKITHASKRFMRSVEPRIHLQQQDYMRLNHIPTHSTKGSNKEKAQDQSFAGSS